MYGKEKNLTNPMVLDIYTKQAINEENSRCGQTPS